MLGYYTMTRSPAVLVFFWSCDALHKSHIIYDIGLIQVGECKIIVRFRLSQSLSIGFWMIELIQKLVLLTLSDLRQGTPVHLSQPEGFWACTSSPREFMFSKSLLILLLATLFWIGGTVRLSACVCVCVSVTLQLFQPPWAAVCR